MNTKQVRKHAIEAIFPLLLFFVFAVSAISLVLLAANIYRDTTESSLLNNNSGTAMSYLSEKLHQHDRKNGVKLENWEDTEALVLCDSFNNTNYYTYIYAHEGALRELFIKEGSKVAPEAGKLIIPVREFSVTEKSEGLLAMSCTDDSGDESSIMVALMAG